MTAAVTQNSLLERFLKTPAGQAVVEEESSEKFARRRELIAERDRLNAEAEKAIPELVKQRDAEAKRQKAAEEKLAAANDHLRRATGTLSGASVTFGQAVDRIERELIDTADHKISEAQQFWNAEAENIARCVITWDEKSGKFFNRTGNTEFTRRNNIEAVVKARSKIGVAYGELEQLKLENPDDVEESIAQIIKGLPTADDFHIN